MSFAHEIAEMFRLADDGVARFTGWRAVIHLSNARKYPGLPVTVMIQAVDAYDHDAAEYDDPHGIVFEADVPGAYLDETPEALIEAAVPVLADEGVRPVGAWTCDGDVWTVAIEELAA